MKNLAFEASVSDKNIHWELRNVASYSMDCVDYIIWTGEEENAPLEISIHLEKPLLELFAEVQDCVENGQEHEEFTTEQMNVLDNVLKLIQNAEEIGIDYFTVYDR